VRTEVPGVIRKRSRCKLIADENGYFLSDVIVRDSSKRWTSRISSSTLNFQWGLASRNLNL